MEIAGKKALVSGGAQGIGRAVVEKLIDCGALVGVLDIDRAALDQLAGERPSVWTRLGDVSRPDQATAAVEEFFEQLGGLDILVNNAGLVLNAPLINLKPDQPLEADFQAWDRVIRTNLSGAYYLTAAAVRKMLAGRSRGLVVNVSSVAASGNAGQGAYSASKAALEALTVAWAQELGPLKIRVAAIAPGFTETPTTLGSLEEHALGDWVKQTPLKRMARPEEIADGILYIVRSDFFNGQVLRLDGGLRL